MNTSTQPNEAPISKKNKYLTKERRSNGTPTQSGRFHKKQVEDARKAAVDSLTLKNKAIADIATKEYTTKNQIHFFL